MRPPPRVKCPGVDEFFGGGDKVMKYFGAHEFCLLGGLSPSSWPQHLDRPQRHEAEVSGLDFFEIARPGLQPGTYQDPNGVTIVVSASE